MFELFQAEWCPHSARVRQRLTELGMDVILRQVEPDPDERDGLFEATRQREIPALLLPDGTVVAGEEAILQLLGDELEEPREAHRHRAKARAEAAAS
jgi:glutathione S-transferase